MAAECPRVAATSTEDAEGDNVRWALRLEECLKFCPEECRLGPGETTLIALDGDLDGDGTAPSLQCGKAGGAAVEPEVDKVLRQPVLFWRSMGQTQELSAVRRCETSSFSRRSITLGRL